MANLTIKNNSYEPIALRQQQSKVGYNGAQIVDQSGFYGQMSKTAGAALKVIQDREESDEIERVLRAHNEFTKRVADIKLGIETNMQGSNAKNAAALYEEQVEAARKDVYANSGLKYKAGENMFNRNAFATITRGAAWAREWENNQVTEARKVTYGLALDENINNVIAGTMSPEEAYEFSKIQGKHLFANLPAEQRAVIDKARADKFANTLVTAAIERNDYKSAYAVFDYLKNDMTSETRAKLDAAIYTNQEYSENKSLATALADSGITDPEEQKAFLVNYFKGNGHATGAGDFESFVSAISGQESGGNYDAVNGRTGASGKYQIMPGNWPNWSAEAGLPSDAPMTPENQEKVARFKLKQYYDKYGARGAAIAWYAGEGGLSYSEAALNRKQGNGDEPSINEYADSILGRMGTGESGGAQKHGASGLSAIRADKIISMASSIRADREHQQKAQADAAFSSTVDTLYNMYKSGVSYEDALGQIKTMVGADYKLGKNFETAAKFFWGDEAKSGGAGGKASATTVLRINDMLGRGDFETREEYLTFAKEEGGFDQDQIYKAQKTYDEYLTKGGMFAFDWDKGIKPQVVGGIKESRAQENAWLGAKPKLQEWVIETANKTGTVPPMYEVVEKGMEIITKKPVGFMETRGTWFNSTELVELSEADYRRSGIVSVQKVTDIYGNEADDLFEVKLANNKTQIVNAAKLYTMTR